MRSRKRTQKKAQSAPSVTPASTQLQSRPFAPEQQSESSPQNQSPNLEIQRQHAEAVGHNLARISLVPPNPTSLSPIQCKLKIGQVGDKYEQEADRVASQVVQRLNTVSSSSEQPGQSVQRQTANPEEDELQMKPKLSIQRQEMDDDEEELQMKPLANKIQCMEVAEDDEEELQMKSALQHQADEQQAAPTVEASINQARGGGQPLSKPIRGKMEQAFNADFSGVRIHTNTQSNLLNRSLQARAFTTGQDIFFRQGEYNPGSTQGQELLAHELTHVLQQGVAGDSYGQSKVQRQPDSAVIQRDILENWKDESKVKKAWGRSKELKAIDTLVTQLNNATNDQDVLNLAGEFNNLFSKWKDAKGGDAAAQKTKRYSKLLLLQSAVNRKAQTAINNRENTIKQANAEIDDWLNKLNNINIPSQYLETAKKFDAVLHTWKKTAYGSVAAAEKTQRFADLQKTHYAIGNKSSEMKAQLAAQVRGAYSTALNTLRQTINTLVLTQAPGNEIEGSLAKSITEAIETVKSTGKEYNTWQKTDALMAIGDAELEALNNLVVGNDRHQSCLAGSNIIGKIEDWQNTKQRYENALKMDSDMNGYAQFSSEIGLGRFAADAIKDDPLKKGLSMDRDAKGGLTTAAVNEVGKADEDYRKGQYDKATQGGIVGAGNLTKEQIEGLMAEKNKYTDQTIYPELKNLLHTNGQPTGEHTETRNVSGVAINVTYDQSDVNFAGRWALIEGAVNQIQAAGFTLPSFNVYLPKCGRKLTVSGGSGLTHTIKASDDINVAVMIPPNTVQISSEVYQNPKVATGLSIRVDPSGIATMVHELGHLMHCQNAPAKFAGLNFSMFKGLAPDGTPWSDYVSRFVSQYGGGNPREFVAEMFVGLVYNNVDITQTNTNTKVTTEDKQATSEHIKNFTRDQALLAMYQALGGAMP